MNTCKMYQYPLILLLMVGIFCTSNLAKAQMEVETRLCFADTTSFNFTSEWQYLSTDIYLFNGQKFSRVVNEVQFGLLNGKPKKKVSKKGLAEQKLEFLMITAQLQNLRFFGDKEIVYPLYNFQINTDKSNKYQTFVSDNIDAIRIIDNLPLYSAGDRIDAKINVRAISQNDRDQIFGFIGSQLKNIANIANPVGAVLSLINEFGNFIESSSHKKEYRFSSTIRLFEQKNFDTRLHSVRVYVLLPAEAETPTLSTDSLKRFVRSGKAELNRKQLLEVLSYDEYPYIVVANYKSLYRMQTITGDEVNQANIDKRKLRIENNYQSGLINEYTYKQEKDFVAFLVLFSEFKSKLELYNMNFKMGNIDAAISGLSDLSRQYHMLLKTYNEADFKYRDDATFKNIFRSEYTSIIDYANLYLEGDNNLQGARAMIKTMVDVEKSGLPKELAEAEACIRKLRFSDNLKDFSTRTPEGQTISRQLGQAEAYLLEKNFTTDILMLGKAKALPDNLAQAEALKDKTAKTSCVACRERSLDAIKDFYARYDEYRRVEALEQARKLRIQAGERLFGYLSKSELMEQNYATLYTADSASVKLRLITPYINDFKQDIDSLSHMVNDKPENRPLPFINAYNEKIRYLQAKADECLSLIERQAPELLSLQPAAPTLKEEDGLQ